MSLEDLKELRSRTGAGLSECKRALDAGGTFDQALELARQFAAERGKREQATETEQQQKRNEFLAAEKKKKDFVKSMTALEGVNERVVRRLLEEINDDWTKVRDRCEAISEVKKAERLDNMSDIEKLLADNNWFKMKDSNQAAAELALFHQALRHEDRQAAVELIISAARFGFRGSGTSFENDGSLYGLKLVNGQQATVRFSRNKETASTIDLKPADGILRIVGEYHDGNYTIDDDGWSGFFSPEPGYFDDWIRPVEHIEAYLVNKHEIPPRSYLVDICNSVAPCCKDGSSA